MKDKASYIFNSAVYWSIVILPFSAAISSGLADSFIGIMGVFFLLKKVLKKERLFIPTPVNWAFAAIVLFSLLSFINSIDLRASFQGITKLLKYLLIFLVCAQEIKDIKQIRRIIVSTALAVSLVSVDSAWQLIFGKDFIRGNPLDTCVISLFRPTASFANSNVLGVYLAALAPLIAGLAIFYYRGKAKIAMLAAGLLAVAGVVLTLSRGAGLGVYLALLAIAIVKKRKTMIVILLAALLAYPLVMPKNIKKWAKEINYNPIIFMCNCDRISTYKNTLNMIAHHPFIGVGVNTFSQNYSKYKLPESGAYITGKNVYAHNIYLHLAGEIGLFGLGAFFYFLFMLFKQAITVYRNLPDEFLKTTALCLIACLIAFLINGLTETNLYYPRVTVIFWYLTGFSLALKKFTLAEKTPT
jgi:O-antigen ligase